MTHQHPRLRLVHRAEVELHQTIYDALRNTREMAAVAQTLARLLDAWADRNQPDQPDPVPEGLVDAAFTRIDQHGLSPGESLCLLLDLFRSEARALVGQERHGNTNTPGDTA